MKQIKKKLLILLVLTGLLTPVLTLAQDVPPPPPPGHGTEGNVPGGGAPIGSGLLILLGISSAYGGYKGWKLYQDKKKKLID